jgi:hypothetical protein
MPLPRETGRSNRLRSYGGLRRWRRIWSLRGLRTFLPTSWRLSIGWSRTTPFTMSKWVRSFCVRGLFMTVNGVLAAEELKSLALELQNLVQTKVGTTKFSNAYNTIRQSVLGVQRERRDARVQQVCGVEACFC